MKRSRQRNVYCTPAERALIRQRAAEARRPVSRFLVECALGGAPDEDGRYRLVLTEEEQRTLGQGGAQLRRLTEAMLVHRLPGTEVSMTEALSVLYRALAPPPSAERQAPGAMRMRGR